jgi:hypothetical protein
MSTNTPAHIDDIITICHNLRQLINQVHASTDPQHKQASNFITDILPTNHSPRCYVHKDWL